MGTYYLRAEAMNLENFVFDTDDLSTVRGGSLLLSRSVQGLHERPPLKCYGLEPVSVGASVGLYRFEARDDDDAHRVAEEVREQLRSDELAHATFVVDVVAVPDGPCGFRQAREQLLAMNRWGQMQAPSLVVPEKIEGSPGPCAIDGLRPADPNRRAPAGGYLSPSVYVRREYGRQARQEGLGRELENASGCRFTRSFEELAGGRPVELAGGKMAVIYLDGNGFGALQAGLDEQGQKDFDRTLASSRRDFLQQLLQKMRDDPGWQSGRNVYRIEILVWGGDDMLLVVPAWKGWEALEIFYSSSAHLNFRGRHLTHAAGMVLCSHKAPIRRVRALAFALCERAKRRQCGKGNYVAYVVLESFDHVGRELDGYLRERWPDSLGDVDAMLVAGKDIQHLRAAVAGMKEDPTFSRRALYRLCRSVIADVGDPGPPPGACPPELQQCEHGLGHDQGRWLHIAELWDYLP